MRNFLHIAVILFAGFSAYAQKGAKIEYKTDAIDYGTVSKKNDNGIRTFEFTNSGDADLVITDVKPTSGFTVTGKPKSAVKPGDKGQIEVKYSMVPGPFRKTITIQSNAVNVPDGVVALKLKGEVK